MPTEDSLDSLLDREHTRTRNVLVVLGILAALTLIGSGLFLITQTPTLSQLKPAMEPLPPFHPNIASTSAVQKVSDKKINLNLAGKQELLELPEVGEKRADHIIEKRPYTSLEDFQKKTKLPTSVVEALDRYVSFE